MDFAVPIGQVRSVVHDDILIPEGGEARAHGSRDNGQLSQLRKRQPTLIWAVVYSIPDFLLLCCHRPQQAISHPLSGQARIPFQRAPVRRHGANYYRHFVLKFFLSPQFM